MGLDARLFTFAFACLPVLCLFRLVFLLQQEKSSGDDFLQAEETMGGEKNTNGDANHVDEEHNRRASIFLPINPLKIDTSRFDYYVATRRGWDIVWLLVSLLVILC